MLTTDQARDIATGVQPPKRGLRTDPKYARALAACTEILGREEVDEDTREEFERIYLELLPTDDRDAERLDPMELQCRREFLGLTVEAFAQLVRVRRDTARQWESGRTYQGTWRYPTPYRLRRELAAVEEVTMDAVERLGDDLHSMATPAVQVWSSDEDFRAEAPYEYRRYSARWWRHVVARALLEHPSTVVTAR